MYDESYNFQIGNFNCTAVCDGTHTYSPPAFPPPAAFLFANASKENVGKVIKEQGIQPEDWLEWISPYICLLVNTGKHLVLVDTGAGNLSPETGKLVQNLNTSGISPYDIDTVILTHGHPDHLGDVTDTEGRLVFPNARHVIWKDEWQFWMSEQAEIAYEKEMREVLVSTARKNLQPLKGQIDFIEYESNIVPGIRAIATPGHTPGHMALLISSKEENLIYLSDTTLHPLHLEYPEWCAAVDLDARQVLATRRKLLNMATAEKTMAFTFHFPFPGLGRVSANGNAWQWQPVKTVK
jgi:glyoxylase-like metal-dependent hydrolase (beta-lactamase superfamily II)